MLTFPLGALLSMKGDLQKVYKYQSSTLRGLVKFSSPFGRYLRNKQKSSNMQVGKKGTRELFCTTLIKYYHSSFLQGSITQACQVIQFQQILPVCFKNIRICFASPILIHHRYLRMQLPQLLNIFFCPSAFEPKRILTWMLANSVSYVPSHARIFHFGEPLCIKAVGFLLKRKIYRYPFLLVALNVFYLQILPSCGGKTRKRLMKMKNDSFFPLIQ